MPELQRLTTEYIEVEDRIRVSGELSSDETIVMWMSQRLLVRLLPHLFTFLERQSTKTVPVEIAQSFELEAAKADLTPVAAVERHKDSQEWLVSEVDITPSQNGIALKFKSTSGLETTLSLSKLSLRQWLSVLQTLWEGASWPIDIWPEWIKPGKSERSANIALH